MRMVRNISIPPAETLSLHLESCVVQRGLEVEHVLVSDELGDLLPLDSLVDATLHLLDAAGQSRVVHVLEHGGVALVHGHLRGR